MDRTTNEARAGILFEGGGCQRPIVGGEERLVPPKVRGGGQIPLTLPGPTSEHAIANGGYVCPATMGVGSVVESHKAFR